MEVIVSHDVEKIVLDHLRAAMAPVPVSQLIPTARPPKFVTARSSGGEGRQRDHVTDVVQITVDSWSCATPSAKASAPQAAALARQAQSLMLALEGTVTGGMPVYRVDEFAAPSLMTDPESTDHFYRSTFSLRCRAAI